MIPNKITKIKKRDGRVVDFDQTRITHAIHKAIRAVGEENGAASQKIADKVVYTLNRRFKLNEIPTVEQIQDIVEETLIKEGRDVTAKAYILYRQKRREIREAKYFILGHEIKTKLTPNAMTVLESRYLRKNKEGKIQETPQQLFQRVASNISAAEKIYRPEISDDELFVVEEKFYRMMANLEFLPNSPTLMNAGAPLQQLSGCFVLPVNDSMVSIFDAIKNAALVHQSGGGTGFDFSQLRPEGDAVKTTQGTASGPLSFMRVFDAATETIKQGGRRRGANMGILRVDHPDILEFIIAKEKEGILKNFNISVALTNDFISAVEKENKYALINPRNNQVVKKLDARKVFDLIAEYAWKNGEPGVIFIDVINQFNPTPKLGRITSTNPCVAGRALISTERGLEEAGALVEKYIQTKKNSRLLIDPRVLSEGRLLKIRKASRFFKSGFKKISQVVTKSGYELMATPNHKLMTLRGWVPISQLTNKDEILLQSAEGAFNQNENLNFKNDSDNLPSVWSEDLGFILGWFINRGQFIKKGKNYCFDLAFGSDDMAVRRQVKNIFKQWPGQNIQEIKGENNVYYLSSVSQEFVEFSYWLGLKPVAWLGLKPVAPARKTVPPSLFRAPKTAVIGFLKGVFSSDGVISAASHKSAYIKLASPSIHLLKGLQLLLLNLGIKSKIDEKPKKKTDNLNHLNKAGLKKYYPGDQPYFELKISQINAFLFLKNIGLAGDKFQNKIKLLMNKKYDSDDFKDRVLKVIRDFGRARVYNFTEPVSHSYIANGFVVSNCGEQPLLPYESCNLGSINLSKLIKEEKSGQKNIDWAKMKILTGDCVRFLDNVIDMNLYPLPEIEYMTKNNRKIGLGIMGWADMLIQLEIPYNSTRALKLAEKVMRFIYQASKKASQELAAARGHFPAFQDSVYDRPRIKPMRNATTTTIAPTGTIGIIANASSGIEPLFAVAFVRKHILGGDKELIEINPFFEKIAKKEGFYSKELMRQVAETGSVRNLKEVPLKWRKIFITALEMEPEWHIRMQAAFQKYVDNATSKTINFPFSATIDDIKKSYLLAYKLGCKGLTVYRTDSRQQQVLNIGQKENKEKQNSLPLEKKISESEVSPELRDPEPNLPDLPPGSCPTCNI